MPNLESRPDLYSVEKLASTFVYDEKSGFIYIRKSDWSRDHDKPLGIIDDGYVVILYQGFYVFAHRLAFVLKIGRWPNDEVDHRNRLKSDNSWLNLREATRLQNVVNRGLRNDNKTGIAGISIRRNGFYRVRIDGERKGDFKDFFEACCIRKSAELKSAVRQSLEWSNNETIS